MSGACPCCTSQEVWARHAVCGHWELGELRSAWLQSCDLSWLALLQTCSAVRRAVAVDSCSAGWAAWDAGRQIHKRPKPLEWTAARHLRPGASFRSPVPEGACDKTRQLYLSSQPGLLDIRSRHQRPANLQLTRPPSFRPVQLQRRPQSPLPPNGDQYPGSDEPGSHQAGGRAASPQGPTLSSPASMFMAAPPQLPSDKPPIASRQQTGQDKTVSSDKTRQDKRITSVQPAWLITRSLPA